MKKIFLFLIPILAFVGAIALADVSTDGTKTGVGGSVNGQAITPSSVQTGTLTFPGATSGLVTVVPAAVAGTWTFTLPTNSGTNAYVLSTDGAGVSSWIPSAGGGTVSSVGVVGVGGLTITGSPVTSVGTVTVTVGALTPTSVNSSGPVTATNFIGAGTGLTGTASSLTAGTATATASQTGTGSTYVTNSSPTINTPTFVAPALGTIASGVATNLTGTAASLTAGTATNVVTNANLTGPITSIGNATTIAASPVFTTDASSPKWRSTAAKVLFQGLTTGATQLASTQTTVPTCSTSCGNSPSVAGSDSDGIVTMGGTGTPASGWVVTFNGTWAAAPSCIVQSGLSTMVVGKMPIAVLTSTTTFTVTTNGTAPSTSDKYQYHCRGTS